MSSYQNSSEDYVELIFLEKDEENEENEENDTVVEGIENTIKILGDLELNSNETSYQILIFALNIMGTEGPITLKIGDEEVGPIIIGIEGEQITSSDIIKCLKELALLVVDRNRYCFAGIGMLRDGPYSHRAQDTSEWLIDFD